MQEEEIEKIIINSKDTKEKYYYNELKSLLTMDPNITNYTTEEADLARELAPKSKIKLMEHDFTIVICCKKDNTEMFTTNDRDDIRDCLNTHLKNKERFNNIDKDIMLLMLDKFALAIDEINNQKR